MRMSLIKPLAGVRPVKDKAEEVAAPPYDVLNSAEAKVLVEGHPLSFLHISKAEIDLPEGTDPYDPSVYQKAAENFAALRNQKVLIQEDKPVYYVYRLTMGAHVQTGLVATASVEAYDINRVRKHEFTRPMKEDDRVNQVDALNAQTGPVFLVYKQHQVVDQILADTTQSEPEYNIVAEGGVRHEIWVLSDDAKINTITDAFDAMDAIYVADGHHRSAAGSRVGAMRKANNANHTGDESYNYFLSVIFPDNQMQILDYNRVITSLNGLSKDELIAKISESFSVNAVDGALKPSRINQYGMYVQGQWYELVINSNLVPDTSDPVGRLDISLLANHLIEPILGISDPRTDKRIDFVGGIRGMKELEKRVDSGEMAVAFSVFATRMEDLMSVADANEVMPPKSTWFEPKLADGLVSHVLD
jgi:uncharacterized protein (DUF1015 family)